MMMIPRKRNEFDLFRDFFEGDDFFPVRRDSAIMKTDIKENDKQYIMKIELPGFKKEDISINYENAYVTINASRKSEETEDKYIRKERSEEYSRRYYVGHIDSSEIKASYEDGVLKLEVPKENPNDGKKGIQIN